VLRKLIKECKPIIFEGDNYSDEWVKEAKKRGLSNNRSTPEALDALSDKKMVDVFVKQGIYSELEVQARHSIMLDEYIMKVQIESRVMGDLALNHVIPAAIKFENQLLQNYQAKLAIGIKDGKVMEMIKECSEHIGKIRELVADMTEARKKANAIDDERKRAYEYCNKVKPYFDNIRYHADKLELLVDDEMWPLPKYRELLFLK
jgi:glutamine synthetase